MSVFTAVFDLGQMVGPPLLGLIAQVAGYPTMFLTAATGVVASLAGWIIVNLREVRS